MNQRDYFNILLEPIILLVARISNQMI